MKLTQIFQKPVDRTIEGVIKADDESSLLVEIEEYVLTNEISKRLESFLEAYNNFQGANGAWVSGFFGSGKSHLLKILAMLLENRMVDGVPVLDRFLPKCEDNAILKASLLKAVAIPSKSILFNIDQKADVISKTQSMPCWQCLSRYSMKLAVITVNKGISPTLSATWIKKGFTHLSRRLSTKSQESVGKRGANRPCWKEIISTGLMPG